jgi:hypothetical protein
VLAKDHVVLDLRARVLQQMKFRAGRPTASHFRWIGTTVSSDPQYLLYLIDTVREGPVFFAHCVAPVFAQHDPSTQLCAIERRRL